MFLLIEINYLLNDNIPPTATAHEVITRVFDLVMKSKCQIYILLYQQCYTLVQHPSLPLEIKPAGLCFGFTIRLTIKKYITFYFENAYMASFHCAGRHYSGPGGRVMHSLFYPAVDSALKQQWHDCCGGNQPLADWI